MMHLLIGWGNNMDIKFEITKIFVCVCLLAVAHIMNVLIVNKWLNTVIGFLIGFVWWSAYILWSELCHFQ